MVITLNEKSDDHKSAEDDKEKPSPNSWHVDMIHRKAVCFEVAIFSCIDHSKASYNANEHLCGTEEKLAIYGLVLEPTGIISDEYGRIGVAEMVEEDELANGWDSMILTIV